MLFMDQNELKKNILLLKQNRVTNVSVKKCGYFLQFSPNLANQTLFYPLTYYGSFSAWYFCLKK